jgi:hypothetical protein
MTKWTITYAINKCRKKTGATWEYLKLTGAKGAESRGIVDFVAVREITGNRTSLGSKKVIYLTSSSSRAKAVRRRCQRRTT